jgi:hypothetical protein
MTRLNNINRYVETAFVAAISLIALAGIIRFVVLAL